MDSDSGDYKCVINNPTGEITTTAKINLKGIDVNCNTYLIESVSSCPILSYHYFYQGISCTDIPQKCHVKCLQCCKYQ